MNLSKLFRHFFPHWFLLSLKLSHIFPLLLDSWWRIPLIFLVDSWLTALLNFWEFSNQLFQCSNNIFYCFKENCYLIWELVTPCLASNSGDYPKYPDLLAIEVRKKTFVNLKYRWISISMSLERLPIMTSVQLSGTCRSDIWWRSWIKISEIVFLSIAVFSEVSWIEYPLVK